KGRRKEETEERRRSFAWESRESFSRILPFTWPAARRRVLRSRGNEKTEGTLETQTEMDLPSDISEWNSMTGIESTNVILHPHSTRHLQRSARLCSQSHNQFNSLAPSRTSLSLALLGLLARALRVARRATTISSAQRDCALDATNSAGFWNVRIADDDRHTCCVSIDATTFLARRGPARDLIIERRNRRVGSDLLTRSRSIAAGEEIFRSTVNDITIGREDRFFEIPLVGTTDFPECNGRTLSSNTSSIVLHEVNGGSSTTVREIGRPIDSDVNTENLRTSGPRLIEIGIVESSCEEQPCVLAEEIVRRRDTSPTVRFPAKLDPGGRAWRTKTDTRWRLPRIGLVQRTLLLGLLATSLLCDMVLTAPSSSSVLEGRNELEIIRRSIVQGLGLQRIPDPSKANVSQAEYERAHREYLKQVQLSHDGQKFRTRRDLHVFQAAEHPGNKSSLGFSLRGGYHRHSLYFPVAVSGDAEDVTVDHASLRFLLQGDHRRPRDLEALIYLRTPVSRRLLLRREIPQGEPTGSRWMELDSTEAAASWLEDSLENHGLELEFLHDGQPIRREVSHATLNVFTTSEPGSGRRKRSTPEELMPLHKGRRSRCKGDNNKKCCRHELTVMFKDLKGFEFIVYPKGFDAGYCKGRCPPRYNPAHHHALLQSLLWKEDRKRVPKPCCAPSKLDQLMIVYFDENQSTQLKVSYWKNIQVLECACS
ncbi:60A protein, partial [Acromyrmex insinuator]